MMPLWASPHLFYLTLVHIKIDYDATVIERLSEVPRRQEVKELRLFGCEQNAAATEALITIRKTCSLSLISHDPHENGFEGF
jgi:hypothetical protein